MIDFKPNPLCADLDTLRYIGEKGSPIEKSVTFSEIRKGFNIFGKIQVPHFLINKRTGTPYTQNYNMNPNKDSTKTHSPHGKATEHKSSNESSHSSGKEITLTVNRPAKEPTKPVQSTQEGGSTLRRFADSLKAFSFFGRHSWSTGTMFANWIPKVTKEEIQAIKTYTGDAYTTINGYMRGNLKDSDIKPGQLEPLKNIIQHIKNAIAKSELTEDIEVHRVMDAKDIHLFQHPDRIYQDMAFLSTTPVHGSFKPKKYEGKDLIHITIKVPKGKGRGAWVAPLSDYKKELEFLMPSACKFRVTSCESKDGKNWEVAMELTEEETEEVVTKAVVDEDDTRIDRFTWKATDFKILRPKKG